jgi:N-acetylmuramoyl-L-alanine amidase
VIKKPQGAAILVGLEDLYVTKSIRVRLTGLDADSMNNGMVARVFQEDAFIGEPVFTETVSPDSDPSDDKNEPVITRDYGKDFVHGITVTNQYDEASKCYTSDILIEMDDVYAQLLYEDEDYYYIDLKKPKEVYDRILVIDAGHGGKDAGALSEGDKYYEKNINLDILLQLKELLDKENIKVYYTRTGDDKVYLKPRVQLANSVDCDFFISIHCNASEASWPKGTEVYYYDSEVKGVKNKDLANLLLEELEMTTTLDKREVVKKQGDEIYILKKALVPAILIEVGYLTNNSDMSYLSKKKNREAVAQGIYNGIIKAYEAYTEQNDGL